MPTNRIHYLGAVGLAVTVGLAAGSAAASAPATGPRLAADSAQASSKIAFIREPGSSSRRTRRNVTSLSGGYAGVLYVMNPDGSGQRRLSPAFPGMRWSPDGQKIAFTAWSDGTSDVYVMNADGSGQERLTSDPSSEGGLAWSPDGRAIAFARIQSYGDSEIYVMNADGSQQRMLTRNPGRDNPDFGLA